MILRFLRSALLGWLTTVVSVLVASAAAPDFGTSATTLSQSGQFVVSGPRKAARPTIQQRAGPDAMREVNPQTLAVSCDRIKSEILRALDVPDVWRAGGGRTGKIFVAIDPTFKTNSPPSVEATPFEQGWHFRVRVPTSLTEDRMVRAITQVVSMELASRRGNQRAGQPPLWFVEGLTQFVLSNVPEGVLLEPQTRAGADYRGTESLAALRDQLTRRAPLEFHELSLPDFSRMGTDEWKVFSASSHFAVREFIRLPKGQLRLVTWLGNLQNHWNWQTGFLETFAPTFRSLLDVEKWWALAVANFTGRNQASAWTPEFALLKLDEALRPVGLLPGAGNRAGRLSIQEVITHWEFTRQPPLLRQLLQQLNGIRINSPLEVSPLAYRYLETLENYLNVRSRAGFSPVLRGQPLANVKLIVRDVIARLRELDGERSRIAAEVAAGKTRPAPPPPSPTQGRGT